MLMTRIYKKPPGWKKEVDADGNCTNIPPIDHLMIRHTGTSPEQNFSTRFVADGVRQGYVTLGDGKLTLKSRAVDEKNITPLVYKIKRTPGRYCCHCGVEISGDHLMGQAHVETAHKGKKSPDPQNPSGYLVTNAYECVLDAKQHERLQALPIGQKRKGK